MAHCSIHRCGQYRNLPVGYTLYKVVYNTVHKESGRYCHYLVGPRGVAKFHGPTYLLKLEYAPTPQPLTFEDKFARALTKLEWRATVEVPAAYAHMPHPPQFVGRDASLPLQ